MRLQNSKFPVPDPDDILAPPPEFYTRYTFPDFWVDDLFKEFLIALYTTKEAKFAEIIVLMIKDYSKWNRINPNCEPVPVDNDIISAIGFDLLDLHYDEKDVRMYFHKIGYDLDSFFGRFT